MTFVAFVPLVVSLAIYLIPVHLLRRKEFARAQDYFVSSEHTPPRVIQNASIAYSLKVMAFIPFFTWGASGDYWPIIISAVFFGVGVYFIYVIRRPILEFMDAALIGDRSITLPAFIAREHGNDPRVRLLAAGLSVFALAGLVIGETLGVATLLKPALAGRTDLMYILICGMLMLAALYTIISGNSGVMRSVQTQLGIFYLGLYVSTALVLYILISAVVVMPAHATLAVLLLAGCSLVVPSYRRARYVDTSSMGKANANNPSDRDFGPARWGAGLLMRFEKSLNVCICLAAALVIVVCVIELSSQGLPSILADSAAALRSGTSVSRIGLMALCLLPLFYPIVDMTNWQRIAAFEKDENLNDVEPTRRTTVFRGMLATYAVEGLLAWLFMGMFGAIAALATATQSGATVMQDFFGQLATQQNSVATAALSMLVVSVFAMALATMSSAFSAGLCVIRYDILPAFRPELESENVAAAQEAMATRRTLMAGGGLLLGIVAAYFIVDALFQIDFTGNMFLALLFAFSCAQLAIVPLVLGPVIGRKREGFGTVSSGWALLILVFSAAAGVAAVIVFLATGDESFLWSAVPTCLGSGFLLFLLARLRSGRTSGAA
jgi:hypothetical protein